MIVEFGLLKAKRNLQAKIEEVCMYTIHILILCSKFYKPIPPQYALFSLFVYLYYIDT